MPIEINYIGNLIALENERFQTAVKTKFRSTGFSHKAHGCDKRELLLMTSQLPREVFSNSGENWSSEFIDLTGARTSLHYQTVLHDSKLASDDIMINKLTGGVVEYYKPSGNIASIYLGAGRIGSIGNCGYIKLSKVGRVTLDSDYSYLVDQIGNVDLSCAKMLLIKSDWYMQGSYKMPIIDKLIEPSDKNHKLEIKYTNTGNILIASNDGWVNFFTETEMAHMDKIASMISSRYCLRESMDVDLERNVLGTFTNVLRYTLFNALIDKIVVGKLKQWVNLVSDVTFTEMHSLNKDYDLVETIKASVYYKFIDALVNLQRSNHLFNSVVSN